MRTEYAHSLAKDFDLSALVQIRDGLIRRSQWCYDEVDRRNRDGSVWSYEDVRDLVEDAQEFFQAATHLNNILSDK